ncbi:hypothetical protein HPB48_014610 [Haemaphysalis longicornis]|uniref:Uncharacterized protein n=1 Tax=Haemaphysalis longicornis TaxID=44386 RepID=A0A9J6FYQ7_HAELO|nr:hypothetical protein HPB48_014610 [Haemaphysalis longicornis]
MRLLAVLLPVAVLALCHLEWAVGGSSSCGPCELDRCETPSGQCLAGMVRDSCGCCMVCGQREGQRCYHPSVKGSREDGPCGEDLECRPEARPGPRRPRRGPVRLHEARARVWLGRRHSVPGHEFGSWVSEKEVFEAAPRVVTAPENTRNRTGGRAAMTCEVTGFPVPTVEWRVDRGDGPLKALPTDNSRISVQSRGGPDSFEVTSWLQLLDLRPEDTATYWCIGSNENGEVSAAAKLNVLP